MEKLLLILSYANHSKVRNKTIRTKILMINEVIRQKEENTSRQKRATTNISF